MCVCENVEKESGLPVIIPAPSKMYLSNCFQNMVFALRDVEYVSRFQRFFGLEVLEEEAEEDLDSKEVNAAGGDGGGKQTTTSRRAVHNEGSSQSSSLADSIPSSATRYRINNHFWYYLFSFGSKLGYEFFYSLSFSYCYWNVDSFLCRRLMLVWALLMYVGQALKELIRWPRPSGPSIIILEPAYSFEYGMPSTHAILALSIPVNLFHLLLPRYSFSVGVFALCAFAWCSLICCSRLYLGMHSVLVSSSIIFHIPLTNHHPLLQDIIAGLALTATLLVPLLPLVDSIDHFLVFRPLAPPVLLAVLVAAGTLYPSATDPRSPSRGDTCVMIAATAGVYLSTWLHYHLGLMVTLGGKQPALYSIHLPGVDQLPVLLLRTVLGLLVIAAFRFLGKTLICQLLKRVCGLDTAPSKDGRRRAVVEVPTKLFTYLMVSW